MPNYSRNEIVLIQFPFSDLTNAKIRPAVVINAHHISRDIFVVALTSRTTSLLQGEFVLTHWAAAGLNAETAVKRAVFTVHERLVLKSIGYISEEDSSKLDQSLRIWMDLD
jgi:mRNA interferase MazF